MKPVKRETNRPPQNLPYRDINQPFRFQFVIPGNGIMIEQDANGICYISTSGVSPDELVAGDNIEITRKDGKVVISAVDSVTDIAAGQNVTIDIDPETGTAIINSIIGGADNEHYKGVFDTAQDLIAYDTDPELGDYGLVKNVTYSDGGEVTWNGQYKYCFYINGQWTVVDQMLTFTKNSDLLQQFYSVGGSSPVIYLHEIARTGNFEDLDNIARVATPEVTVSGDTVTVTCETEGAEIWYSTDGSMPHVNGTKYTGPITAADATSFRFVGIKNGMINSFEAVADADFSLQPPTIELDYLLSKITLGNPNVDGGDNPVGSVYYTIDGSEPTSASTLYTGEFVLPTFQGSNPRVVKAVVYDSVSGKYSPVASESYQYLFVNGTEYLNVETGRYNLYWYSVLLNNQRVADANTYYTTDGSDPDYNSDEMTAAIHAQLYGSPTTLKLKAYAPGKLPSAVRTLTYGYAKPTAPTISFDSSDNMVTLGATGTVTQYRIPLKTDNNSPETGYRIYYTLDGSTPTAASTIYTGPFAISGNVTVKAVIVAFGQYSSDVAEREIGVMTPPSATLDWRTGSVTMVNPNAGGEIHYTLDGSTPTAASALYTEPVVLTGPVTVKMIVVNNGATSAVTTETYDQAGTVELSYSTTNPQTGMFSIYARGSRYDEIRYAIDSLTPPAYDTSTPYTSPIVRNIFDTQAVYSFRIFREGLIPGATESVTLGDTPDAPSISYNEDTGIVTLALDGNTAAIQLQTNNNVPELGARIYYTLDGSTPVPGTSAMYTAPFALPEGVSVIKAVTECFGHFDSEVTTENVSPAPTVDYLTFTAEKSGSRLSFEGLVSEEYSGDLPSLEYSDDGGNTWQELQFEDSEPTNGSYLRSSQVFTFEEVGDTVMFRGDNPYGTTYNDNGVGYSFFFIGDLDGQSENSVFSVTGDLQTIVDKTGENKTAGNFQRLFQESNGLLITQAPDLTADTLVPGCYGYLFYGQNLLTDPASMPNLTENSFPIITTFPPSDTVMLDMYRSCSGLTRAFDIPGVHIDGTVEGSVNLNALFGMADAFESTDFLITTDLGETLDFLNSIELPFNVEVMGQATPVDNYETVAQLLGNTNGFPVNLTLEVSPDSSYGSVSGGGVVPKGVPVGISATANNGYFFRNWSNGDENAVTTVVLDRDKTLTAYFSENPTVSVIAAPGSEAGSVSGSGTYPPGSVIRLTATPNPGYTFVEWSDGNTDASRDFVVPSEDTTVIADFARTDQYPNFTMPNGGTISLNRTGGSDVIDLEYSKDGQIWNEWVENSGSRSVQLNAGETVYIRSPRPGDNINEFSNYSLNQADMRTYTFSFSDRSLSSGNLSLLLTKHTGLQNVLPQGCFRELFKDATYMEGIPILPLANFETSPHCFESMFENCTSINGHIGIYQGKIGNYSCRRMFYGCTSLTGTASNLPNISCNVDEVGDYGCESMFEGCTSLVNAPSQYYQGTPKLPAMTIGYAAYDSMFSGCSSLQNPPELPATALSDYCYSEMFQGCVLLTTAPILPAATVPNGAYVAMFYACRRINSIVCLATTIYANSTMNWLYNVASSGTFQKDANMTGWASGADGIPTGWTVQDYQP